FSSRRRHTRWPRDWSSDVCSSDLLTASPISTSPIDGIALSRDVEMGDAVSSILVLGSSATLVMTLGDTSEVYVKGKVDESDIGRSEERRVGKECRCWGARCQ